MIETLKDVEMMKDGSLRLVVIVYADGEECGRVTVLSGPAEEVRAYATGKMTLREVRAAWSKRREESYAAREQRRSG